MLFGVISGFLMWGDWLLPFWYEGMERETCDCRYPSPDTVALGALSCLFMVSGGWLR